MGPKAVESGIRKDHAALVAVLFCLVLLWQAGPAGGAVDQEARLFERAYEYYLAFQPDKAVSAFDQFLKEYPTSSARDSVLFWQAKSLLLMNRTDDARSIYDRLIAEHPDSPYRRFAEQEIDSLGPGKRKTVPPVPAPASAPEGVTAEAVTEMKKDIANLTAEAEKKDQDLKKAADVRADLEARIEKAKKEHEQLTVKVKEGEAAIASARQLADENAGLRKSLAAAERKEEQDAAGRQAQLQQLKSEVEALKKAGSEKERLLNDERVMSEAAARRVRELEDLSQQRLDRLKTELAALVLKEIDSKQKNWEELDAYLKELRSEKEMLTASLGERDRLIGAKDKEIQSLRQNRAAAEELKGVIAERDALKARMAEAERVKSEAARQADQDTKDRERLAAEVKTLKDDRDRLAALVAGLEAKGQEGQKQRDERQKEIQSLQSALTRMTAEQTKTADERKQISGQLELARARISENEAAIAQRTGLEEKVAASLKERQALLAAVDAERKRADGEQEKAKQAEVLVKDAFSERDALQARIAGIEKTARDEQLRAGSELKILREERDGLVARLKETEKVRAAGASQSEDAARRIEALSKDLERIRREHEEEKKALTASLSQIRDDKAKLSRRVDELSDAAKRFETPVVKISGRPYTLSHVLETVSLSNAVLRKLGRDDRPWRKKGLIDDFIAEEVLSQEAARRGISPDAAELQSHQRRLSLSEEEKRYLKRYYSIERLVKTKMDEHAVDWRAVRDYYEKNREQFMERQAGRQARVLSVRYEKSAELEKSLTALAVRQEAVAGRSFEEIQKGRKDGVSLRTIQVDELPGWIREKLAHLADGEVSPVYSTGKEHLVLMVQQRKPAYRKFEDVKDEIAQRIGLRSKGTGFLSVWIDELAADVEYLQ